MKENEITQQIIGAAIEVQQELGPGPLDKSKLLTYLRLSQLRVGLIINFHVERLIDGVVRIVNRLVEGSDAPSPPDLQA
jgi:hypothetical protein